MLEKLQKVVLKLNALGEQREQGSRLRRFFIGAGNLARKPAELIKMASGMAEIAKIHEQEVASWVGPDAIATGEGGPFDACDLRHWLALAERTGVPFIPAREILRLTEDEMDLLSGSIQIPNTPAIRRLRAAAEQIAEEAGPLPSSDKPKIDQEALEDRLFNAMDEVPEGWMVRSNRCGSSELKALAGLGAIGERTPEVRFGPHLEVGPGWVRVGNRRRVHVSDNRTISAAAEGPGFLVFLARPWVESSRYIVTEDPHRHGSQFAGKGVWPAEWRVFVENGQVTGVASYYGWCDKASPETARNALEARRLAQLIVDEAMRLKAYPRYADIEFIRNSAWLKEKPELDEKIDVALGRETVSCTLDFIETHQGLMLLEGGPPNSPIGGGHPCAFAGAGGPPKIGSITPTVGVAFRVMDHVLIADPATWEPGDTTGCILSWDEVEALAAQPGMSVSQ